MNELAKSYSDALLVGSAKDYAEYRHLVGKLEGVTLAFNEIEGLLDKDDLDDDATGR